MRKILFTVIATVVVTHLVWLVIIWGVNQHAHAVPIKAGAVEAITNRFGLMLVRDVCDEGIQRFRFTVHESGKGIDPTFDTNQVELVRSLYDGQQFTITVHEER